MPLATAPAHPLPPPTYGTLLPLAGLTILAVEDSRFASEALRLLCQRSGARLRRADTLAAAAAHLRVYRPDVVIVDLGLPDGRGEDLIRRLAPLRDALILGSSGDPGGRAAALAAGAAGFLDKPLESLAAFQRALMDHLPGRAMAEPALPGPALSPDPLALQDDLSRAARLAAGIAGAEDTRYLAGFVNGLARASRDSALERAALGALAGPDGLARLRGALHNRLDAGAAFFPPPG